MKYPRIQTKGLPRNQIKIGKVAYKIVGTYLERVSKS
jgi:hypothetical protein